MNTKRKYNSIELMIIQQMVAAIAVLRINGYTTTTFEDLKDALFVGLSEALQEKSVSRENAAAILGMKKRSFFDLLRKATDRLENSQHGVNDNLYYEILLFINKNSGVSKISVLDHFGCYGNGSTVREAQVLANINLLKERKLLWESGRGDETSYTAPSAELPDEHEIELLETSINDHLKAISQSIICRCEALLRNEENGSFLLTVTLDIEKQGELADRLASLTEEYNGQLRALFEESESQRNGRDNKDSVTLYMGQYWTNGDQ